VLSCYVVRSFAKAQQGSFPRKGSLLIVKMPSKAMHGVAMISKAILSAMAGVIVHVAMLLSILHLASDLPV
jgi:hypothetical protein